MNRQPVSREAYADVADVISRKLHDNPGRGYRGGELFGELQDDTKAELENVTQLCYLLKRNSEKFEVDHIEVYFPNRQEGPKGGLVTVFFSQYEPTEEHKARPPEDRPRAHPRHQEQRIPRPSRDRTPPSQPSARSSVRPPNGIPLRPASPVAVPDAPVVPLPQPSTKPEVTEMIQIKQDKISNFIVVRHDGSNTNYRIHKDDVAKLGTDQKVSVYNEEFSAYYGPSDEHPSGRYTAKTKVFIASYLRLLTPGQTQQAI